LGFNQFFDPDAVAAQMDTMWDANDSVARSLNTAGLTYYFAQSNRQLGPIAWAYHSDLPASMVYQKPGDKNHTLVAWNEGETPVTCHDYKGDQVVGQVTVPSRKLSVFPIPLSAP